MLPLRLVAIIALAAAVPATATTMYEEETVCPVGGKAFKHMAIGSYTTFGALPDGMPVGTGPFPMPMTECPENGLVLYRDFDAATAKRVAPLVLGPEYQAMRTRDTPSWRAWWLADHLAERDALPWMLLAATWEAKAEPADTARLVRYQEAFVAAASARPANASSYESVMLRFRAANALRELGRFDDARRLWSSITIARDIGKGEEESAKVYEHARVYVAMLGPALARHDLRREPIDLIGEQQAALRCATPSILGAGERSKPLTAFDTEYCARPAIKALTTEVVKANARGQ